MLAVGGRWQAHFLWESYPTICAIFGSTEPNLRPLTVYLRQPYRLSPRAVLCRWFRLCDGQVVGGSSSGSVAPVLPLLTRVFCLKAGVWCVLMPGFPRRQRSPLPRVWSRRGVALEWAGPRSPRGVARCAWLFSESRIVVVRVWRRGARVHASARAGVRCGLTRRD
jgi:hypothetical protein